MAPCVNRSDARCLYGELDRDSRWSVQTMHKLLLEMRTLVDASYPEDKRAAAMGAWADEVAAADDGELFAIHCAKRRCFEPLIQGFGAVTSVTQVGEQRSAVVTTRGGQFILDLRDGRYGLSEFQQELQQDKIRLFDRLEQVKKNAKDYEETRRALGLGGTKQGER